MKCTDASNLAAAQIQIAALPAGGVTRHDEVKRVKMTAAPALPGATTLYPERKITQGIR
jgi:hypothetical protein